MKNKKKIRSKFKLDVFKRDNYTCMVCGTNSLIDNTFDSHHITDRNSMPNGGYVKENGITVCKFAQSKDEISCHMQVEKFHLTNGKEWNKNLHPNDLYNIIGSSYEEAYDKSMKL